MSAATFSMLLYCFIMSITPGPNNIICLSLGVTSGYRRGVLYVLGVVVGCLSLQWIFYSFGTILDQFSSFDVHYIGYLGAAYLIYMGIHYIRTRPGTEINASSIHNPGFFKAIVLQFINPKAYIFNATMMLTFVVPMELGLVSAMTFSLATGLIFFICCSTWVLFGQAFKALFTKYDRWLNPALGLSLIGIAFMMVI